MRFAAQGSRWAALGIVVACAAGCRGPEFESPDFSVEPTSTFSIVAHDPSNGDLGVAVASRFFAVGSVVPWAQAGVGAIATQSYANTTYGPKGLALLASGVPAPEVVQRLTSEDTNAARRQLAVVDSQGRVGAFSGDGCHPWAGSRQGKAYSVQGNLLVGEGVVDAMAKAFEASTGELAERLVAAMEAGERAGGDARGRQSAALYVVRRAGGYAGESDRYIDLRVDDHPRPIVELRRLLEMRLGRDPLRRAAELAGRGDLERAIEITDAALSQHGTWDDAAFARAAILLRSPRRAEGEKAIEEAVAREPGFAHYYWRAALLLAEVGRGDKALAGLRRAVELNPGYREVLRRELRRPESPLRALGSEDLKQLNEDGEAKPK
jgi:uncharacterized Ntn-hydrolase superfamily protein